MQHLKVQFKVILAVARDGRGIGVNGQLPWQGKLAGEMAHFEATTLDTEPGTNVVLMGRRTWESLPPGNRPLKRRLNIVISGDKSLEIPPSVFRHPTLTHALHSLCHPGLTDSIGTIWVIGGAQLYQEALGLYEHCEEIVLTEVDQDFDCDAFVDLDISGYRPTTSVSRKEDGISYLITWYRRKDAAPPKRVEPEEPRGVEWQYIDLVNRVLSKGTTKDDRTGVGTLSLFGEMLKIDLSQGFPLLTTKKMYWKGVVEELLWFIRGSTDSKQLEAKGVNIWKGNSSREFLDQRGLTHLPEGDCGPIYGFQWRHFGASYQGASDTDYQGQGVDQLARVIRQIREQPTSRRIVMSAWDPAAVDQMALPPCHVLIQFEVSQGRLNSALYQRSGDLGLGVPFNIASYALLTSMVAHVCGLEPGVFTHFLGDCHIYLTHVDGLSVQLKRSFYPLPRLVLDPAVTEIDQFRAEHISIEHYNSHPAIKLEMAV